MASRPDWEAHKELIVKYYWLDGMSLEKVMKIMRSHNFDATKRQYKKQVKDWGLVKNISADDMKAMLAIQRHRYRKDRKGTRFFRHGKEVKAEQLARFATRNRIDQSLLQVPAEPPRGIRVRTPEVEGTVRTLPPGLTEGRTEASPPVHSDRQDSTDPDIRSPATKNTSLPEPNTAWFSLPSSPDAWPLDGQSDASPSMRASSFDAVFDPPTVVPYGPQMPDSGSVLQMSFGDMLHLDGASAVNDYNSQSADQTGFWNDFIPTHAKHVQGLAAPSNVNAHGTHSAGWLDHPQGPFALPFQANQYPTRYGHPGHFPVQPPSDMSGSIRRVQNSFRGHTPLHRAVMGENIDLARRLLEGDTDVNAKADGGITPLHYAAFQRHVELVKLLKEHGARLDAMTDNNRSILYFAVSDQDRLECSNKLPYYKPGFRASYTDEDTVKVIDTLYSEPLEWRFFRESLAQADSMGVTPLMAAAETGFVGTAQKLIRWGAKLNAKDNSDYTALKYAVSKVPHNRVVRLLLQADDRVQEGEVRYMLKLARRNLAIPPAPETHELGPGFVPGFVNWRNHAYNHDADRIASEMAREYHRLGKLDEVIALARRRDQNNVAEKLENAKAELVRAHGNA
ncbi:ankyrin repeat-containing domain protein [Echria macrotheca]|uniref:Ankyrin repeat-containing domain protein n=1 Tax=Echria macrotheca TaxID=438768 RepID=A0AAJ0F7R6_9PEZI|nr:ankyrin repeat-containing domain protein [Echria macrotheca]